MNRIKLKRVVKEQRENLKYHYIDRDESALLDDVKNTPFVVIYKGVRRCGKSSFLNILQKSYKQFYFFNFDDDRISQFTIDDFETLHQVFVEVYGECDVFFFDEIQNIDGWEKFVNRLYNEGKKVYITGSNANMLSADLGTHLTGRNVEREMFPFSFREYLRLKKVKYDINNLDTRSVRSTLKKRFTEYMKSGGFPEYLLTGSDDYLRSLFSGILYRDIITKYNLVRNEKVLKELILYLYSNACKEFTFNSLKEYLELSNSKTVKDYVNAFKNAYLLFTIKKYDYSLKKQKRSPKKSYPIDTALARLMSFRFTEDLGRQLENVVFLQLKRMRKKIYYHRAKKGECDFIIKDKDKIKEAYQVCLLLDDPDTKKREIDGLLDAMKCYNLKQGYILTDDEEAEFEIDGKTIIVKPVWEWLIKSKIT